MTGFGLGEAPLPSPPGGRIVVEIRAVNHRYLDVRVKPPSQLADLAGIVETIARERLTRGRFDVGIRLEGAALSALSLDEERASAVYAAFLRLRDRLAPGADVPLSLLAATPDLFVPTLEEHVEAVRAAAATAFDAALRALDEMRVREGVALAADVTRRLGVVRKLAQEIAARGPLVIEAYKRRLKERLERLRLTSDVEFDPGRLEQEIALFADRCDVAEELTRLDSHTAHFELLLASTEPVGRRLDFLLQEMAREANTVGAKSQDAVIAHAVVEQKAEIERMREQVQNVE